MQAGTTRPPRGQKDAMDPNERLIREFYEAFNERRLTEAAGFFAPHAVLEHAPIRVQKDGGEGYLEFVRIWTGAFPDAMLTVERVASGDGLTYDVDIVAGGTHLGTLDMGSAGRFKPTGSPVTLHVRQILEIQDGRMGFSSLAFDVHDIVQQLVSVDATRLLEHLERIRQLGVRLAATPESEILERRNHIERLGAELDAARNVVRPYFVR
jgi:hypothetical protein